MSRSAIDKTCVIIQIYAMPCHPVYIKKPAIYHSGDDNLIYAHLMADLGPLSWE